MTDGKLQMFAARWLAGAALAAMTAFASSAARAQDASGGEIVVTGTSIRGAAPVGSTVVSVGQDVIDKTADVTMQQILQNVPAVVGFQSAGQGAFTSVDGANVYAPSIHGLGASASNSTLILVDGHRMPLAGLNHELADPDIIPTLALQRVEVLADGASSIYGSDAVAGVINLITRKSFNGFEAQGQAGFGDNYHTYDGGFIAGKSWDGGTGWVAYNYDYRSDLLAGDRSYTQANHTAQGGSNLASLSCGQATIGIGSTFYPAPYSASNTVTAANAPCDYSGQADLLPSESRNNVMAHASQDVNDRLTVSGDIVYSDTYDYARDTRGSQTVTIYGPGSANTSQINPYFTSPAGVSATSESIRWDGDSLLGPGAYTSSDMETFYASGNAEYKLTPNWRITAGGVVGSDTSRQSIVGALNSSAVDLALNGTTNGAGSLVAPSIPGTSIVVLNTPLTTANALDPYLVAGNPTSAAVLAKLVDSTTTTIARHDIQDGTLKLDGDLFSLPAGPVKLAVGGEYARYTLHQDITRPLGIGPASTGSSTTNLDYERTVESGYVEFLIPAVAPQQAVPLVRHLDFSVSGRIDDYSDFGDTSNPKFGANWEVISGLKLRGSYATSFVAPALTSRGNAQGVSGDSSFGTYPLGPVNVPLAAYPALASVPGCSATAATCQIGTTITGIALGGANGNLKPETGRSWDFGADYAPALIPGLKLSATWWHVEVNGAITSPTPSFAVNAPGLHSLLTIYPNGATAAQIAAATAGLPQVSALPATTYFIYDYQQQNALNMWVEGVDFQADYAFNTGVGRFALMSSGTYKTRFDEQIGDGSPTFSVLNTTGFNTAFPSIQLEMRSGASWSGPMGVSLDLFWNHTGSYKNWSATTLTPITHNAAGLPIGGGDTVAANDTFDGHIAYDFKSDSVWAKGLQVYADAQNMFDKAPPFYNSTAGYDTFAASPIGRVISIGLRKQL